MSGPARPLKIAFVGLPLAALLLAADGHEIVWAGVCRKGALGTRRLRRTLPKGRVLVKPSLGAQVEKIRALSPDLLVSWFWTTRVPEELLTVAKYGALGVHPSLLPRHRGGDPYFAAIDAGDTVTGVSAHVLEAEYDTGDVLGRRELPIDPSWTAWRLAKKLDRPSLALLRETVRAFAEGRPPVREKQDESRATGAALPTEDELELDFSWSAERLARRVRAASPYPGAYFFLGEEVVTLSSVEVVARAPEGLAPGEAALDAEGFAVVRAGEGALRLLSGRLAGDDDDDERPLDRAALAALVREAAALP